MFIAITYVMRNARSCTVRTGAALYRRIREIEIDKELGTTQLEVPQRNYLFEYVAIYL